MFDYVVHYISTGTKNIKVWTPNSALSLVANIMEFHAWIDKQNRDQCEGDMSADPARIYYTIKG